MGFRRNVLLAAVALGLAASVLADGTRTYSTNIVGVGVWDGIVTDTDSIVTTVGGVTDRDSTVSASIYVYRARRVLITYSSRAGTALAHVPILEASNDDFATFVTNPLGVTENLMVNNESIVTSVRRTLIAYGMNNNTSGEADVIPWKYVRVRFGPLASGADTLNCNASVTWTNDGDRVPEQRTRLTFVSGALSGTCAAGDVTFLRPGMQVWEEGGNTAIGDRTYIASISGTTVTLTRKTAAAITASTIVYAGW